MPRYALLRHEVPPDFPRASHWDFLVEQEHDCLTWALEELPASWCGQLGQPPTSNGDRVPAIALPPHRKHYLTYEGPVSDNRGVVTRVAAGECEVEVGDKCVVVRFGAGDLRGAWWIERFGGYTTLTIQT